VKVRAFLSIGFANGNREEVLELEEGLTEEQVEEAVMEWKNEHVEWSYERIDTENQ
jgi:hypothetical protein